MENGADPDISYETGDYDDENKDSLLYKYTMDGNEKIEKLLLKYGATPLTENEKQKLLNERLLDVCDSKNIKVAMKKLRDAVKREKSVEYSTTMRKTEEMKKLSRRPLYFDGFPKETPVRWS